MSIKQEQGFCLWRVICCAFFFSLVQFPSFKGGINLGQAAIAQNFDNGSSQQEAQSGVEETQQALEDIQRNIQISDKRRQELEAEVQALQKENKNLNALLAQTAKQERSYTQEIAARTVRLRDLENQQDRQQKILIQRRAEMAEILAGLEKMGYNPPPAVLVHSDDAVQSLYSSVLMGSLLPQIQQKMKAVKEELGKLSQIEKAVKTEQQDLDKARAKQVDERMRLALLIEEKWRQEHQKQKNLQEEEQNRRILAEKAQSLQDLMREVSKQKEQGSLENQDTQIQIAQKFSTLRGKLQQPVEGERLISFGQKQGDKRAKGEQYETAPGAIVLAPAEGVVRYAGQFRSYGQVVILDLGENYYIVLAGMAHIHVNQGQFLLQGEPVGNMENLLIANEGNLIMSKVAPKLYIELRKNGNSINPAPWWAKDNAN